MCSFQPMTEIKVGFSVGLQSASEGMMGAAKKKEKRHYSKMKSALDKARLKTRVNMGLAFTHS